MQRIKLYLTKSEDYGDVCMRYKFTDKDGFIASHETYVYLKHICYDLRIIDSEKCKFADIRFCAADICRLLEEGIEVYIV